MLFFTIASIFSQKEIKLDKKNYLKNSKNKIDSLKKIDFLNKDYKYLNKDFIIIVDSATFNKGLREHKFYKEKITTYRDSLGVILMLELKDWHASRIAENRITFDWEKISYYIWESEEKSKEIGKTLFFSHPYRFFEYITNESINDYFKKELIQSLTKRIKKKLKKEIEFKTYKQFFTFTFEESQQRRLDMDAYFEKRKIKNHKH